MYQSKGMKHVSVQQVKDYLVVKKLATKVEITQATGLSTATITNILKELMDIHYIERVADCESTGGRKAKRYRLCGQYMYFGLIHLQLFQRKVQIQMRIIDLDNKIVFHKAFDFELFQLSDLEATIMHMRNHFSFDYLALSVPGIVDNGNISECDIEILNNINLAEFLKQKFSLHVTIENDVNTAMLGYIHFHTLDEKAVAFVYQPDNHQSGCGLYLNHNIVYGTTHFAGELGFLPNGSREEQARLLAQNPMDLLVKQIVSIIAIINPSHIILYSPCVGKAGLSEAVGKYIPSNHLPQIIRIDSMDEFVFKGLASLGVESARFKLS